MIGYGMRVRGLERCGTVFESVKGRMIVDRRWRNQYCIRKIILIYEAI
jgi:hypothetical protein